MPATSRHFTFLLVKSTANAKGNEDRRQRKKNPKTWQTFKAEAGKAHRKGKDLTIGPIYYKV